MSKVSVSMRLNQVMSAEEDLRTARAELASAKYNAAKALIEEQPNLLASILPISVVRKADRVVNGKKASYAVDN